MNLSKLALARIEKELTQAQVADYVGVDVGTVCRWEKGSRQPIPRHIVKLSKLFGLSAQALGLTPDEQEKAPVAAKKVDPVYVRYIERDLEFRLDFIVHDWKRTIQAPFSCVTLQHRITQETTEDTTMHESEQSRKGADVSRREALRRLAMFPIPTLGAIPLSSVSPAWAPQEILPHYAAGITACQQLSKETGEDIGLASRILTTYIAALKNIVTQSSQYRQEASRLLAQALLLKARLSVHREGPKPAMSYGKQAEIYAKESGDIALQLIILRVLAWIYACDNQEKVALGAALQGKALLKTYQKKAKNGHAFHPSIESCIFASVAKMQARNGQDDEALAAVHEAYENFFAEEPTEIPSVLPDFNYSTLLFEDGLTHYHLGEYEQALSTFDKAIDLKTLHVREPAASQRVRVEIINNGLLTSLKQEKKEKEFSMSLWIAGIQGAIELRSEQRFAEAIEGLSIMQALWPADKQVKGLRDLAQHW